jgi:U3 small nucleolar RNA-associated protein 20
VPSTDDVLVISTWKQLQKNLPEANPEVQRAVAEVWGSVLRRLKAVPRASGLLLLSESLDGVEDAAAWALVLACKVSRQI